MYGVCINTPTFHVNREEERGERKTREYKKRVGRKMGENAEGEKERREEDKEGRNEEKGYTMREKATSKRKEGGKARSKGRQEWGFNFKGRKIKKKKA